MLWRAVAETIRKTVCKKYAIAGWSLKTTEAIAGKHAMAACRLKNTQNICKHIRYAWLEPNKYANKHKT